VERRGDALLVSVYDLGLAVRLIRIAITAAAYEAIVPLVRRHRR
jgi:hypothetical protein